MAVIAIIGSGPAGLIAAEKLAETGYAVTVFDRMPSVGRKFLMAGRGGLNLTHSEDLAQFVTRYGDANTWMGSLIRHFPPEALMAWSKNLGVNVFTGSSGRVFPDAMKASPLLRAWLRRLADLKVDFSLRRRWVGWDKKQNILFRTDTGETETFKADAMLLALGGASWPRLGSDGAWAPLLSRLGVDMAPLRPSNAGFTVTWSDVFREKFAGMPLKPLHASFGGMSIQGEAMISASGIEGGAIYALSAQLRDALSHGPATLMVDLRPGLGETELTKRLSSSRGSQSLSNFLRKAAGLSPIATGLLYEQRPLPEESQALARLIKHYPLALTGVNGIDRAISTAGGLSRDALDENMMIKKLPGVFAAGEMLDWEAPTGGYLLQGCFASGVAAAAGIERFLD